MKLQASYSYYGQDVPVVEEDVTTKLDLTQHRFIGQAQLWF